MSTNTTCPCSKRDCEGISYHDDFVDRRMSDLATFNHDMSTDPAMIDDIKGRISGIKSLLQAHRPFCSPVLQGRIDDALSMMTAFDTGVTYGVKPGT